MRFRAVVWILVGLAAAVALGVLLNFVTSDAGSVAAAVASIVALLVSAIAALIASRQAFLSKQAVEEEKRRSTTQFGTPQVTIGKDELPKWGLGSTTVQIGGVGGDIDIGRSTRRSEELPDERELLGSFADLEAEATRVLNRELGERRRSIFDMRADLTRLGIWSEDDVRAFDQAVRVRNIIVHDGIGAVRWSTLQGTPRIVRKLTEKLKAAS